MNKKAISLFAAAILIVVALCATGGIGSQNGSHMAAHSMECCSMVSSGFVMETGNTAAVFFTAIFFTAFLSFFFPSKVAIPLFRPPRY